MPLIKARVIKHVKHIGHFDQSGAQRRATFDGPGIAVSTHPEAWRGIAGLNGPEWELTYTAAHWVDALSFTDEDLEEIQEWMVMMRYMHAVTAWVVDCVDEKGEIIDRAFSTRKEAAAAIGSTLELEEAGDATFDSRTTEIDSFMLEKRAMARLGGWPDPLRWHDAAILLFTREVIMPKRPLVMGVWWDEPLAPERGLCPSGVLFPERLGLFDIEDEEGVVRPFRDAFPDFVIPGEEPQPESVVALLVEEMKREERMLLTRGLSPRQAAMSAANKVLGAH